eukprot:GEMP01052259.1.p1 GENE.GEMP01052259.1~~GEMP01052259.1.p1  ORF type:complete len:303 (+),score=34.79 GEMP01052259.1:172-1080(+)
MQIDAHEDAQRRESRTNASNTLSERARQCKELHNKLITILRRLEQNGVKECPKMREWLDRHIEKGLIQNIVAIVKSSCHCKTRIGALGILQCAIELRPDVSISLNDTAAFVHASLLEYGRKQGKSTLAAEHLLALAAVRLLEAMYIAQKDVGDGGKLAEKRFSDCLGVLFHLLDWLGPLNKTEGITEILLRTYRGNLRKRCVELCRTHPGCRLFGEILLQLANAQHPTAFQLFADVLSEPSGASFLYTVDINILVDVLLRDAGVTNPKAVQCLHSYTICYPDREYKKKEIAETLEEFRGCLK